MINNKSRRIALFVSFSGQGGVERGMSLLSRGLLDQGVSVDLILPKASSEHLESIPPEVNIIQLGTRHTFTALFPLARYLKRNCPDALLAAKHRAIITAVLAGAIAGYRGKIAGNIQTTISEGLAGSNPLKRFSYYLGMKLFYKRTDLIVAISEGVSRDIREITGLRSEKITVISNPVVTPEMIDQAREPVDHPWLNDDGVPVILGIGRLTRQKDFHSLLKAFAEVHKHRPCRLVILGDGEDLASLRALGVALGIEKDLDFPGFQKNPFAWLARSDLFVLSSRWEGLGMVLVEALALGIPVVSTDCPNGPREILQDGKYGLLVPVETPYALAQAMVKTLDQPLPAQNLTSAASNFTTDFIAKQHILTLLN